MPKQPAAAPLAAARPIDPWSEVRAHDHVMRYRRAGAGRAVLLLGGPEASGAPGDDALWPGFADALAARFRVITPDVALAGADVALWLNDFLDGLGAAGVAVVAADQFCIPALELVLLDADRVARVVLVPGGRADETGLDGALATTSRPAAVPLLIVRRALPAAEALPLVAKFLAGDGAPEGAG